MRGMKRFMVIVAVALLVLSTAAAAKRETFRFAQITDIHLTPDNPSATECLLKTIAQINATDSIDFVLLTGDLTENGDRATLMKVKECISLLKMPVYTIMGNHETKWSDTGCTAFSEIFGGERFGFEHKGVLFLGFNSGPLMRMAYGHVAPQDVSWMTDEMRRFSEDGDATDGGKPIILVTHYPMLDGDVDNWYSVTDAVRPFNVSLFIGGHHHVSKDLRYDGIPGILMRSNLADAEGLPGYGVYDVTEDSVVVYTQRIGESRTRFAAFPLVADCYNHNAHAGHYPDFSVNYQYDGVKEKLVCSVGAAIYSSPVVDEKRMFVGDDSGRISAFCRKSGRMLWTYKTGARIVGTPSVEKGVLVFGSADKNIYGLDASNGALLWSVETQQPVLGAVATQDGVAYIGGSDGKMRAIDVATGSVIWTYRDVSSYVETRSLLTDGKVIFGAWNNTLYCLEKTKGKEQWKWTGGLTRMHFSPAAVWPVYANGRVFIADPQRALTAIDITTGETVWRTFRSKVRESLGVSSDESCIFAKTMQDCVVCYSTLHDTPTQIWATDVGFGYEHAPSMPQEKDGVVYGGTVVGLVYALSAHTGEVIWKHKIGNSLINTVLPISDKEVLVTSSEGKLVLLRNEKYKTKR